MDPTHKKRPPEGGRYNVKRDPGALISRS